MRIYAIIGFPLVCSATFLGNKTSAAAKVNVTNLNATNASLNAMNLSNSTAVVTNVSGCDLSHAFVARPGYRNAWNDCGGVSASATERMRTIAAGIKGWAKPRPFRRNAAQDAGKVHPHGLKPGPGTRDVYPASGVWRAARDGLSKARDTKDKYGM
eukprot:gnl/MRDRNA2_/MRDRNA2_27991_c0_seq1.p1 gnl/MRDRNA2_/MRDRNA2_27991_c0~~gnl/MRDRNA2_/MRDRNA2_27991_c0_seq1.p1  ORF type:complete len:156 (-),score=29.55 gnl/MRDRNA2_/MRDRNA2_27991_c0_seq1:112-579(-)